MIDEPEAGDTQGSSRLDRATPTSRPTPPALDPQMRKYMRARAVRKGISSALSTAVRIGYRGRLDPNRHSIIIPESSLSPWRSDAEFREVRQHIEGFTLLDEMRLYELWSLMQQVARMPGDVLEVGVWRGGSGCMLAKQERRSGGTGRVFLCDTFAGVVNAGSEDPIYAGGEHSDTSPQLVRALADSLDLDNVELLVGTFPDETADSIADRRFKLCHLDVDVYESTRASAEWIWPRLLVGGVIVVDDYGGDSMDGVQRAVSEVTETFGCRMVHNLNGHAILVKAQT